jgi:hypothetical protein
MHCASKTDGQPSRESCEAKRAGIPLLFSETVVSRKARLQVCTCLCFFREAIEDRGVYSRSAAAGIDMFERGQNALTQRMFEQ